ncbi:MAG: adenylosuccinate lyase [Tannerellaceae bacterium]|jgi:adenylosuccinate lyase|nr:adenylosuccinate lyase [Tannerellaceae bacterium]
MILSTLTSISPIDGRYRNKVEQLALYFSEFALIKYRVQVEIEYFISLSNLLPQLKPYVTEVHKSELRTLYRTFSQESAARIKETERVTNHDVKAVEYFVKEEFGRLGIGELKEFVHFGLTSQDINNTAFPLSLKDALSEIYYPELAEIIAILKHWAEEWKTVSMLAKTHGQPASPTRLGKEIMVFAYRLEQQLELLKATPITIKFGGATGNFNSLHCAYPEYDWKKFADTLAESTFGLKREAYTTQISNYDHFAAQLDAIARINTILLDFCRDFWTYISMDYFKQRIKEGEVGSSAMPHKVNPIDFENAEGNLGIANAILKHLSAKLPISRLQRDLTDSTVMRNAGVPIAHTLIAFKSIKNGMDKLILNKAAIDRDMENNWAVVAEGIQTILRREGYANPYEILKTLTRTNSEVTERTIKDFIDSLNVKESVKSELKALTPHSYVGI